MKATWQRGELEAIRGSYGRFESMIEAALASAAPSSRVSGGIQSDAAALVFENKLDALRVGQALFRRAFDEAAATVRFWLRGVLVPCESDVLMNDSALGDYPDLGVRHFTDSLLEAIIVEQSFKGPRLLVAEALVDQETQDALAVPVGTLHVVPLKRLRHAPTPDREIAGPWWDLLYLVPDHVTDQAIAAIEQSVSRRMRWAAAATNGGSPNELAHVALLTVVWAETLAILRSVQLRS